MTTRQQIIDEARTWLGTPFHHQAALKGVGADCWGIIGGVARALGLSDFQFTEYSPIPDPERMGELLRAHLIEIHPHDVQPGDIYWIRIGGVPRHLAFATDVGILHSYYSAGRCVETSFGHGWRSHCESAFRFPGVTG